MADDGTLVFRSWRRNEIFDRAVREGPRLAGKLGLRLTDTVTGQFATGDAPFTLMAAADIGGIKPAAIRHLAPAPFARDAETTKLVHLDLHDPDLPWRYTPLPRVGDVVKPWLALLVGTTEELRVEGGSVTLVTESVLQAHDLSQSHLWAHTQEAGGSPIARIVSPRGTEPGVAGLLPQREYVAALVPTFNDAGEPMWTAAGVQPPGQPLPAFHSWRFWTAEAGDFETLATALSVPPARDVGKATLRYRRHIPEDGVAIDAALEVRGAITSLQQVETPQQDVINAVWKDLDTLNDEIEGTIGLPHYGRPWLAEPDAVEVGWPRDLLDDPRFRGSAGLGVWMGVEAQEALMDAAVAQAGALREAGQRIGHLALGLLAGGRLWDRRMPTDPHQRLAVLGPMTARLPAAGGGTVLEGVTAASSPLVPGQFSSAAQRLLRDRTATTRHLAGGAVDRTGALIWANQREKPAGRAPEGVPHVDAVAAQLGLPSIEKLFELDDGWVEEVMAQVVELLDNYATKYHESVAAGVDPVQLSQELAGSLLSELGNLLDARMGERGLPCGGSTMMEWIGSEFGLGMLALLRQVVAQDGPRLQLEDLVRAAIRHCMARRQCEQLGERGRRGFSCNDLVDHAPGPDPRTQRPIDLIGLSGVVSQAVDPRGPRPPAKVRLCSRLVGVDCATLVPPEYPIGLDFPAWGLLKQYDREWLLPGADSLAKDSVTALQTNPAFIDAFMVGINTQFMSEMRWRDLAVARTCTPLRMFWGQVDYVEHSRKADIEPLAEWAKAPAEPVGALSHQTIQPHDPAGNPSGSRLVITFRSDLFRRYPATLVYLVKDDPDPGVRELRLKAVPELDMPADTPDADVWRRTRKHFGPVFAGTLTPELTFFTFDVAPSDLEDYWLVLDEPPAELRFGNHPLGRVIDLTSAATVARSALDRPTRIAIDGKTLVQAGIA